MTNPKQFDKSTTALRESMPTETVAEYNLNRSRHVAAMIIAFKEVNNGVGMTDKAKRELIIAMCGKYCIDKSIAEIDELVEKAICEAL